MITRQKAVALHVVSRLSDFRVKSPRRNEFESGGRAPEKLCRAPPLFDSKITISRFGERFRDGQYSLVSFLFAVILLTVPLCQAICKSEGRACAPPQCPMESAPLTGREEPHKM